MRSAVPSSIQRWAMAAVKGVAIQQVARTAALRRSLACAGPATKPARKPAASASKLRAAVSKGDQRSVKRLLATKKHNVNMVDKRGRSLLMTAVRMGHSDVARQFGVGLGGSVISSPENPFDLAGSYPSHEEHAHTHPIPKQVLDWFWSLYLGPGWEKDAGLRRDPGISPIHSPRFDGLAPAFVLTAGLDPLRDEGDAYARRLAGAAVATTQLCAMGTVHGFLRLGRLLPAAGDAIAATAGFLRTRLAVKE